MAYVLPLPAHSPLKRSFSDTPFLASCSSLSLVSSQGTIRHKSIGNASSTSLFSLDHRTGPLRPLPNGSPSSQHASSSSIRATLNRRCSSLNIRVADSISNTKSKDADGSTLNTRSSSSLRTCDPSSSQELFPLTRCPTPEIRVDSTSDSVNAEKTQAGPEPAEDSGFQVKQNSALLTPEHVRTRENTTPPFRRWVSTLRRRNAGRHRDSLRANQGLTTRQDRDPKTNSDCANLSPRSAEISKHRKTESHSSSLGIIGAVKTASVTLASTSVGALRSRASRVRLDQRGSGSSDLRASMDSNVASLTPPVDEATWLRSVQRRKVLEELVTTEESYVADMKAFMNVYLTLLASMPGISPSLRMTIKRTVTQMVQLHEELIDALYKILPQSQGLEEFPPIDTTQQRPRHIRWHSADVVPCQGDRRTSVRQLRHSSEIVRVHEQHQTNLTADTQKAAQVGRVFNSFMHRFLIYEAWAAQSETLHKDVLITSRNLPNCSSIERGVEILSRVENPLNSSSAQTNKALTLLDLLVKIKPIQRVCKYPLLFESLCKQTPACDDPIAHDVIQNTLIRLREMADEVNKATDNPQTRQLVETTWLLRDRLIFDRSVTDATPPAVAFRLLGRVILCGVLHVAFETEEEVKGQYMICILYRSCLILAIQGHGPECYVVVAVVWLLNASLDEADNGKGLQCHTSPHTWKLAFESSNQLFEIMLSACSAAEEEAWRSQLRVRISAEAIDAAEGRTTLQDMFCSIPPELKPIGLAVGQPESLARRISIRRAATLAANRLAIRQVIIKNTQAHRERSETSYQREATLSYSHSHHYSRHIDVLAPRRAGRIRLETILTDVWTKESLPYPGMAPRRAENPIRASASSVIRKLSMASIASNFSRRSASHASVSNSSARSTPTASYDSGYGQGDQSRETHIRTPRPCHGSTRSSENYKVDFHTAPDAFLPQDFELHDSRSEHGRPHIKGRTKSLPRRVAGLGAGYTRNLRALTPVLSSGPSTPRPLSPPHRPLTPMPGVKRISREEGEPPGPSSVVDRQPASPLRERARLTKAPPSVGAGEQAILNLGQLEGLAVHADVAPRERYNTTDGIMEEILVPHAEAMRNDRRLGKVRSKLFRLWTG